MGEWIARIDADDMSEPSRLAMQLDFVRTNKTCVLVGTARSELDEHGNIDGIERFPCHHSQLCRMMLALLNPIAHSSAFIQAKALRSVGGYRTRIKRSQDYDLWLRLSELGTVACIDKPLVRIRHHANQVSHESSGLRSIVDSTVALASFLLKRRGHADPVSLQSSDEEFQQFWQFIHQGVLQDKTWEFRQFMGQLKASLQNPNTIEKCSGIFFALRNPPLLVRLVHTRTFGERLAEKLVEDWINRGKKLCAD